VPLDWVAGNMDLTDERTLAKLDFFAELPAERMAAIDALCEWHIFERNEVILERSARSEDALFILGGEARVVFRMESGEEIKIAKVGPYDVIGALSAIDTEQRSADVVANSPSRVASMKRGDFITMLRNEPAVAMRLLSRFARIIRSLNTRVKDLSLVTPQQRLYGELLRLARPSDGEAPLAVAEMPNHEQLAEWANTTRDVVAFAIGSIARRGIVERKHKTLYIRDPEALRDLARY
jgi:CRP/FNR family cyclic AMP-dependent transcriptional regulator